MRLLPDTLFGRLISAVLGVVAVAVLIIVVLIVRDRRELLFAGSEAEALATTIADTVVQLNALPALGRVEEIARIRRETLTISRGAVAPGAPAGFPTPLSSDEVAAAIETLPERLASDLGADFTITVDVARSAPSAGAIPVRIQRRGGRSSPAKAPLLPRAPAAEPGPPSQLPAGLEPAGEPSPRFGGGTPRELDVAIMLPDGETIAFRTDVPRAGPPLPRRIFLDLALLTLALGAVLFVMARTITRPLTDLARAADAVGRGERGAPLRESGARELREATRAFNAMQERMHRYLDSRTQVLAAMSHDLRTPLTRLKLRAESLDDDELRQRFNADLDEMQRMIVGALSLFRGMNQDEPLQPVAVDEVLATLQREFAELGTSIVVAGDKPDTYFARPTALKRCLTNLLANAAKYGMNPAVVIEQDASELTIRVLDEGPGIPPEMLEQVFEPFFRLESSRNRDTGGVGLGLSIARDIAQAHGGSLTLRNRSPRGLEAILRLPRTSVP
jgi:signal transduction histidine kinase